MTKPVAEASTLRTWSGLAAFYASQFVVLAVYMQFFPVWLHEVAGLAADRVSAVLAALTVARTLAGPLWAQRVDRVGDARPVLLLLSVLAAFVFAGNAAAPSVAWFGVVSFAFGVVYSPMFPILDAAAMQAAQRCGFGFGRLRLVGSVTYLLTVLVAGAVLERTGAGFVLPLLMVGLVLNAAVAVRLPRAAARAPFATRRHDPWWDLLRARPFVLLLVASALIQGSHATYYNLSTVHWNAHGIDKQLAGALWGEGVLAEIVLLFVAARTVERLRPTTLLMIGGAAAVLRWSVIASTTNVPALFATNWLHGLSFACTYLGSLRALERRVAPHQRATAQGLLGAATSGLGMVGGGLLGGALYTRDPGFAFFTMAGLAALGAALAFVLRLQADRDQMLHDSSTATGAA